MKEEKEDISNLECTNLINAIYVLINNIYQDIIKKSSPQHLKIELVDDIQLARTLFNEHGIALKMEINKRLFTLDTNELLFMVLLHEIAHIETEKLYPKSGHNGNYRNICKKYNIPFYEKIPISNENMRILEEK